MYNYRKIQVLLNSWNGLEMKLYIAWLLLTQNHKSKSNYPI